MQVTYTLHTVYKYAMLYYTYTVCVGVYIYTHTHIYIYTHTYIYIYHVLIKVESAFVRTTK